MLKVSCAIIIQNKKILIVQNCSHSDHPFQWEFPGGKIKNRETAEVGIKREIIEELEIEIEIIFKMNSVEFDYGFKQIVLIPFLCSIKNGEIKLNEHNELKWINIDELGEIDFSGADRKLIQQKQNLAILKKYIWE